MRVREEDVGWVGTVRCISGALGPSDCDSVQVKVIPRCSRSIVLCYNLCDAGQGVIFHGVLLKTASRDFAVPSLYL